MDNRIRVNENRRALDAFGYDGISLFDFAAYEDPPRGETFMANADIVGNDVVVADHAVEGGINVYGDGSGDVRLSRNRVRGAPTLGGIFVDLSHGTTITHNNLTGVAGTAPDVYLAAATRRCRVFEPGDAVLDEGTNNVVVGDLLAVTGAAQRDRATAAPVPLAERRGFGAWLRPPTR